jgi:membrane fusion protein (multidrug efflux system)
MDKIIHRTGHGVRRSTPSLAVAVAVALSAASGGCGQGNIYHEPPPPEVIVARPLRQAVTSYLEHTGTAQASEKVELRARVKGFLRERLFKDGEDVEAGQVLFVIDEEPFRVRLAQAMAKKGEAEAVLKKAEQSKAREIARAQLDLDLSQLELARIEESRTRNLLSRNAGSREDLDRAEATRKKAEAQVESDRANLEQVTADYEINILSANSSLDATRADVRNAEIDLGYCRIATPIAGRINSREFDVGNYVGDGQSTVLATVVKTDPIYAYISPSEGDLLRAQKMIRQGKRQDYRKATIPMEMGLGNEVGYPHEGRVDYADPSVDTGTGTIRVRGVFPNPGGAITPGLFVRIRLPAELHEDALLVPDRSLGSDQSGPYLLVVGKDDKVERRAVIPGTVVGAMRMVEGKIGPDDRVVVDGLLRARPGLKVAPKFEESANTVAAAGPLAETSPPTP